ncbi:hypothetical protein GCM10010112_04340 [Actinoplanes lobatus]|uniref:Uncharacterized protein n=1 Tax=Actinoplanes lobatus TaxID=113568 RepID=A0A7W7ME23_9ACTN|nr:hypothetical protein [Actinoplanes lobatus]MBB4746854.1 hypothetical protein [Actinoplanes lobatus]GGN54496.1 hypothetical protein GCM10010112_04340 [Actinoplanes lobatus]GIE41678.1 hypothetical protein Alo02nite_45760 [Actinoplanes lobatus]
MPAIAVPAFALAWWFACYLIGRDPDRASLRWQATALVSYALGVAAWTLAPGSDAAEVLLCIPALCWAGAVVSLLPLTPAERRPVDRGALALGAAFLLMIIFLPQAGRLVVLAPLIGGLTLLWRLRAQVVPRMIPVALTVMAVLCTGALGLLLFTAGGARAAIAALGLDLLVVGYLVAVSHAAEAGERLRPDLRRAMAAGLAVLVLAGIPAAATMFLVPEHDGVAALQFLVLAAGATLAGLGAQVRRLLDRLALVGEDRLRSDRAALFLNADALLRRRERRRLHTVGETEFLRMTRRALTDFGDLNRLARSPLTDLPSVERRLAGKEDQPRARARELRAVLRECVSALRPPGPFGTTDDWRYYNVLQFCCVLGLNPYARRPKTEGMSREARLAVDWFRRYVPEAVTKQWVREAAMIVAERLWSEVATRQPELPATPGEITTRNR